MPALVRVVVDGLGADVVVLDRLDGLAVRGVEEAHGARLVAEHC